MVSQILFHFCLCSILWNCFNSSERWVSRICLVWRKILFFTLRNWGACLFFIFNDAEVILFSTVNYVILNFLFLQLPTFLPTSITLKRFESFSFLVLFIHFFGFWIITVSLAWERMYSSIRIKSRNCFLSYIPSFCFDILFFKCEEWWATHKWVLLKMVQFLFWKTWKYCLSHFHLSIVSQGFSTVTQKIT